MASFSIVGNCGDQSAQRCAKDRDDFSGHSLVVLCVFCDEKRTCAREAFSLLHALYMHRETPHLLELAVHPHEVLGHKVNEGVRIST